MQAHLFLLLLCCSVGAQAAGERSASGLSDASGIVAQGSALVVYGSLSALAASGTVVVESVEASGDASVVVLAGASNAGAAALRLSGRAAANLSLAAGASVSVLACSTGYLLVSAGRVVAFVPNAIGKALLHQSRVAGG